MAINWWWKKKTENPHGSGIEWNAESITDEWFASHFNYAADVTADWMRDVPVEGQILDFGCGDGITSLGLMLRHGYQQIDGVDISDTHQGLKRLALKEIGLTKLPKGLQFKKIIKGEKINENKRYDAIMSWSTFEHISMEDLPSIIENMRAMLVRNGRIFIQINPLYHSPQGAHLARFKLPDWAHLQWTRMQVEEWVDQYQDEIPLCEKEENFHSRSFKDYKAWVLNEYDSLNRIKVSELCAMFKKYGFEIIREGYGRVSQSPPSALLDLFSEEDLRTDELRLLLRLKQE